MDAKFYMDSKFFQRSSTPTPNITKVSRRRGSESEASTGSSSVKQNIKRRGSVNVEINSRNHVGKDVRKKRHPSGGDNPPSPRRNSAIFFSGDNNSLPTPRRNSAISSSICENPPSPKRNSSVFDFEKFVISNRVIPEVRLETVRCDGVGLQWGCRSHQYKTLGNGGEEE